MFDTHAAILVAIAAIVTMALRFLPFLVLGGKETPKYIVYLGRVLPCAIMGMLCIYCLRNVSFISGSHGIPELIGCAITAVLYAWRKNTLLSIIGGTVCYMLLVNLVF